MTPASRVKAGSRQHLIPIQSKLNDMVTKYKVSNNGGWEKLLVYCIIFLIFTKITGFIQIDILSTNSMFVHGDANQHTPHPLAFIHGVNTFCCACVCLDVHIVTMLHRCSLNVIASKASNVNQKYGE